VVLFKSGSFRKLKLAQNSIMKMSRFLWKNVAESVRHQKIRFNAIYNKAEKKKQMISNLAKQHKTSNMPKLGDQKHFQKPVSKLKQRILLLAFGI